MKTTTNTIKFPSTARLFAFLVLISGLAFLSCMVASAQVSNGTPTITFLEEVNTGYADVLKSDTELQGINMDQVWTARLKSALVPETETRLEVEEWMLNSEFTTEAFEEAVELEEWMLDANYYFDVEIYEEAVELEPWMLDTEYLDRIDNNEEPIELEDWMLN